MRSWGSSLGAVSAVVLSCCALAPARAQVPIFLEFQVNTYTPQGQVARSAASDAQGRFVVVWQSSASQDGDVYGVFLQRFNSFGFELGVELQVNTHFTGNQVNPSVAMASDGRFVVVWQSPHDLGSGGIFGRRYDSTGTALATEFQVSVFTESAQVLPSVSMEWFDGAFVVSWRDDLRDGSSGGIFGRRFDSAGAALGGDFQVNTFTFESQDNPTTAVFRGNAGFVVAWQSINQDGFYHGVFAQRFDSSGVAQAGEFQVNQYTPYSQTGPAIAVIGGGFVVTWQSTAQDGNVDGIFARRFDSLGGPLGGEFQINAYTTGHQRAPAIAVQDDSAQFVVAWADARGTSDYSVFARGFNRDGEPFSNREFQVNVRTGIFQNGAVVAALRSNFVVAWTAADDLDGATNGVFARRYRVGVYDVDADGVVGPLTDGLIMLRRLFGFNGATLTAGVLGSECTRCEADGIEEFMGTFSDYDIDGNGVSEPLTDGLLLLRYLFGFRGNVLISGAIGDDCSNCDAPEVEAHIAFRL